MSVPISKMFKRCSWCRHEVESSTFLLHRRWCRAKPEKGFFCRRCPGRYHTASQLRRHLRRQHSRTILEELSQPKVIHVEIIKEEYDAQKENYVPNDKVQEGEVNYNFEDIGNSPQVQLIEDEKPVSHSTNYFEDSVGELFNKEFEDLWNSVRDELFPNGGGY